MPTITLHAIHPARDRQHPIFGKPPCAEVLEMYETFYARIGEQAPWVGYFILRDDEVVGTCGFAGLPAEDCVEIAYWTFPAFEGQGIATAACRALIRIAREADPALVITAKTAPETNASTRILQKHGFHHAGIVQDHEIGDAWLWRLEP